MTHFNPLQADLLAVLIDGSVWKIHTLFAHIGTHKAFEQLDTCPDKTLFKKNFLLMNALYQLQDSLVNEGYFLQLSSLHIQLLPQGRSPCPATPNPLQDYYLDWRNYDTSTAQIRQLLDDFWRAYQHQPTQLTECEFTKINQRWQLSVPFTKKQLHQRWRQLAFAYHPDHCAKPPCPFYVLQEEFSQLQTYCVNPTRLS